ncbi:MAG: type II secretion system minor pseudopilin GspK [Nitrospirae bacterium]|nr:type II secretion system minor pseudopilin GspK [Nitrospirota bacterium]
MEYQLRNNKGIALVITLLVLTLLIVLILEFSSGMRIEARAAANFRDDIKAYYLAKSGVTFAIAVLEEDLKENPNVDNLNETWAQKLPPIPLGDGFVSVEIEDESSKINVNKLAGDSGDKWHELMNNFLDRLELKEDITEAISDWIDANNNDRPGGGAESSYYESLEDPYEAKNNLPDSLQELRLIKDADNEAFDKMKNFVTVVPSDGKINVNTAKKEVLRSVFALSHLLSDSTVDDVINSRMENPFEDVNDLGFGTNGRGLMSDEALGHIRQFITLKSSFFSITSTGEVNNIRKKINAIVKRDNKKTDIIYWRVE